MADFGRMRKRRIESEGKRERARAAGGGGRKARAGGIWVGRGGDGMGGSRVAAGRLRGGRRSFADVVEDEASECTRNEATARVARRRTDPFSSD